MRWLFVCGLALLLAPAPGCKSQEQETPDQGALEAGPGLEAGGGAEAGPREASGPDGGGRVVESKWIQLEAGKLTMGSPTSEACRDDDEDAHEVTIGHKLELAETEVTQEQFKSLMGYNPSYHSECGLKCPVDWVTWHEAVAYCNALSQARGLAACYTCTGSGAAVTCEVAAGKPLQQCAGYRLPTEAEWEYAARAGTTTALYSGDIAASTCMSTTPSAEKIAWYKVNSLGLSHEVGGKAPNAWGLLDMAGNVYEWVHDHYQAHLGTAAVSDPSGPATGDRRVFRGGAAYYNAEHARSANRLSFAETKRFTWLGFRCARTR